MTVFEDLALEVNSGWKRHNYDDARLPDLALAALSARRLSEEVCIEDICTWAFQTKRFPTQPNIDVDFGQPPLTVYADGRLYIEVLFWLDNTTSIHQHSFSGAFYVLAGSSIHSVFRFEETDKVNDRLLVGDLTLDKTEHLTTGDAHPIHSGNRYIHSLFHLGYPSATVVVRNYTEPRQNPQYTYLLPSVAFVRSAATSQVRRTAELFKMLMTTQHPNAHAMWMEWLATADAEATFHVLHHLSTHQALTDEALAEALDLATECHGRVMDRIGRAILDNRRVSRVFSMRRRVTDEKHRLFLALVATAAGRERVLEIVQSVYPGESPAALLFAWIKEMNASPATALGVDDLQRLLGATPVGRRRITTPEGAA